MDEETGVFLHVAGIAKPVNVIAVLFRMNYTGPSPSIGIYIFFNLDTFYTHPQTVQ